MKNISLIILALLLLSHCGDGKTDRASSAIEERNPLLEGVSVQAPVVDVSFRSSEIFRSISKYSSMTVDYTQGQRQQKELLINDLINAAKIVRPVYFGKDEDGLFSKAFSGLEHQSVLSFVEKRLRYAVNTNTFNYYFSKKNVLYTNWLIDSKNDFSSSSSYQVEASNIGMISWMIGMVDGSFFSLNINENLVTIDTPRKGVFILGQGYSDTIGLTTIPSEYRFSILVHEARHSDCAKGLSSSDLAFLRSAKGASDFSQNYQNNECGHVHSICPIYHSYSGLAACDQVKWGAYAFGAVYLESMAKDFLQKNDYTNYSIMKIMAEDSYNRLLYPRDELKKSTPDLSSLGTN